jgi:hypothetical protein
MSVLEAAMAACWASTVASGWTLSTRAADGGDEILTEDFAGGDLGDSCLGVEDGERGNAGQGEDDDDDDNDLLRAHLIFLRAWSGIQGIESGDVAGALVRREIDEERYAGDGAQVPLDLDRDRLSTAAYGFRPISSLADR